MLSIVCSFSVFAKIMLIANIGRKRCNIGVQLVCKPSHMSHFFHYYSVKYSFYS